jgi:hypothetical protein
MPRYDYVAVAVAFIALLVAVYALVTQPKPPEPPPTASVKIKLVDKVVVDYPGTYAVDLGWIYVRDAPAVVELKANYTYIWFLLNGVKHGNPATAVLQPGNYTVSAHIIVYGNATKINISYKVVG